MVAVRDRIERALILLRDLTRTQTFAMSTITDIITELELALIEKPEMLVKKGFDKYVKIKGTLHGPDGL